MLRITVAIIILFSLHISSHAEVGENAVNQRTYPIYQADPPDAEGMVFVKGGCFDMGDIFKDGDPDERPVHNVCVNDFFMGMHEVTQKLWHEVMKTNPSSLVKCDECPVENVSFRDVQEFIKRLNRTSVREYRLPTEAEWEYAARGGGQRHQWSGGGGDQQVNDYAWIKTNSANRPHPVGQKQPNSLGLYDLCGNVQEWVNDFYEVEYYSISPKSNPKGPSAGQYRVARGGAFLNSAWGIRTTIRYHYTRDERGREFGFRLAATPK